MNDDHSVDHEAIDDMLCQLCLGREATCHVTQHVPGGRFEEAYYCAECYEAKLLKPPPARPRSAEAEVHDQGCDGVPAGYLTWRKY